MRPIAHIRELAATGAEFTVRDLRAKFGPGCHAQTCQHLERRAELASRRERGRGGRGSRKVYREARP